MKKLSAKMKRIRMMRWCKLTTGEKIIRVIMKLIKIAVIIAIIALLITFAGAIVAVVAGAVMGLCIMNAVAGGFYNASRAYRPGDRYIHFWK